MHAELNWFSNSWIKDNDKDAQWMMSEGIWWVKEVFLVVNDFSNDVDGFSDVSHSNIFEHSRTSSHTRRA